MVCFTQPLPVLLGVRGPTEAPQNKRQTGGILGAGCGKLSALPDRCRRARTLPVTGTGATLAVVAGELIVGGGGSGLELEELEHVAKDVEYVEALASCHGDQVSEEVVEGHDRDDEAVVAAERAGDGVVDLGAEAAVERDDEHAEGEVADERDREVDHGVDKAEAAGAEEEGDGHGVGGLGRVRELEALVEREEAAGGADDDRADDRT